MSDRTQSLFCYGEQKEDGREQRTYTPLSITRRLPHYWPDGVQLDPCGGPDSTVDARVECMPEHPDLGLRDGLAIDWPPGTFVNFPYDNAKVWLPRCSTFEDVIALGPVRTRRKWFRAALAVSSASVFLDPVAFVGHSQDFPADLALVLWGGDPGRFLEVFADMGGGHLGPMFNQPPRQVGLF